MQKAGNKVGVVPASADGERREPGILCFTLYYMLLFFGYWFGSERFDHDKDGDFDEEDVKQLVDQEIFEISQFFGRKAAFPRVRGAQTHAERKRMAQAVVVDVSIEEAHPAEGGSPVSPVHWSDTSGVMLQDCLACGGSGCGKCRAGRSRDDDEAADWQDPFEEVGSKRDDDAVQSKDLVTTRRRRRRPFFIVYQCLVTLGLWLTMAMLDAPDGASLSLLTTWRGIFSTQAGLDSIAIGGLDLRGMTTARLYKDCDDYRTQGWRLLSYQFTHVGLQHVLANVFLCLLLGFPLEALHGSLKTALMFNAGVFGGAICCVVAASHDIVVGMSGGCYALLGMHLADVLLNWAQKRFRRLTVAFLLFMAWVDFMSALFSEESQTSHGAHFGGYVAGTLMGILIGTNLKVERCERLLQLLVLIVAILLLAVCFAWGSHWPPRVPWNDFGFCWVKQVWNQTLGGSWRCVACADRACVDLWSQQEWVARVDYKQCFEVDTWISHPNESAAKSRFSSFF